MKRLILAAATFLLMPIGCGDDGAPVPGAGECAATNAVGDACAGVPAQPLGDTSACNVVLAATTGDLDSVLSGTSPGDCVMLKPGGYAAVALPANVGLFGENVDAVTVAAITVAAGTSEIADLTVDGGSVTVQSGAEAKLSGTRIINSASDGVVLEAGARITVRRSEIVDAGRYGLSAFDAGAVDLDGAIISGSDGPGVWISCTAGCGCENTDVSSIQNSVIRNNRIVGISVVGSRITLANVIVADTTVGKSFEAGGGISASACSDVDANALTITGNADFGMLIDDSALALDGANIDDNLRGLWVQAIGSSRASDGVTVKNAVLSGNEGVGFGVDKGAVNVSIESSQITDTKLVPLPVLVNGVSANVLDVGDGLAWLGTSQVVAKDLSLLNNARVGMLIDGPVASGSSIADLSTSGTLGILQQSLPPGGEQPSTSGTTPAIESDSAERLAIPDEIAIPPSI